MKIKKLMLRHGLAEKKKHPRPLLFFRQTQQKCLWTIKTQLSFFLPADQTQKKEGKKSKENFIIKTNKICAEITFSLRAGGETFY